MQNRRSSGRFVVCVENKDYPASLELHKIYRVVPDPDATADGDIRVVDESGEDYLYPASFFTPIMLPVAVKRSIRRAEQAGAGDAGGRSRQGRGSLTRRA